TGVCCPVRTVGISRGDRQLFARVRAVLRLRRGRRSISATAACALCHPYTARGCMARIAWTGRSRTAAACTHAHDRHRPSIVADLARRWTLRRPVLRRIHLRVAGTATDDSMGWVAIPENHLADRCDRARNGMAVVDVCREACAGAKAEGFR